MIEKCLNCKKELSKERLKGKFKNYCNEGCSKEHYFSVLWGFKAYSSKCACGCGIYYVSKFGYKTYLKGHGKEPVIKLYQCELCGKEFKTLFKYQQENNCTLNLCTGCYTNIFTLSIQNK